MFIQVKTSSLSSQKSHRLSSSCLLFFFFFFVASELPESLLKYLHFLTPFRDLVHNVKDGQKDFGRFLNVFFFGFLNFDKIFEQFEK